VSDCHLNIIIPIWRGETLLHRALESLLGQRPSDAWQPSMTHVVAVVNDGRSASLSAAEAFRDRMRAAGFQYEVITSPPGRGIALRAAEERLSSAAILYLDQDAALSPGALDRLACEICRTRAAVFATFQLRHTRSPSALVRAFLHCIAALRYFTASPVTTGAYAVSEAGRGRWTEAPPGVGDDKYVRLRFHPAERRLIRNESYEVVSPSTYAELLAARIRYAETNQAIATIANAPDARRSAGTARHLANPANWPGAAVTLFTLTVAAAAAKARRACRHA
jgi:hypothetical protein